MKKLIVLVMSLMMFSGCAMDLAAQAVFAGADFLAGAVIDDAVFKDGLKQKQENPEETKQRGY